MRSLATASAFALILIGLAACGGGKSSDQNGSTAASAGASAAKPPNCGAVKAVWVNLNTKVYHEPGDQYYGNTKNGEYLCPTQAKAQGFHPAGGAMMMNQTNRTNATHHRQHGSSNGTP
jgi:hypothetical protein